jgi:transcriptional regulator with XRE-family HTH domain
MARARAIAALVEGKTQEQAAAAAKVSRRTIWRWMNGEDEEFARDYERARQRLLDDALLVLQRASKDAVAVLLQVAGDSDPLVKARGAQLLLDYVLRVEAHKDFERRMTLIERKLKG